MKEKDLISVIIPVYNTEQYLRQCIDSVMNQTYKNLEIILVNDGSTDGSGKICDEYVLKDNRIKVIHKQNSGLASVRNTGLNIAKGEYIGFIDSDDYIELDMYEFLYKLIKENEVEVSMCNMFEVQQGQYIPDETLKEEGLLSFNEFLCIKQSSYVWNKLYSKKLIGNIRFNENLFMAEDTDFIFEVLKRAEKLFISNQRKYCYRNNVNSITRRNIFKIKQLCILEVYDKIIKYCENNKFKESIKNNKWKQNTWIIKFLYAFLNTNIVDKTNLKYVLQHARKNIIYFLLENFTMKKKFLWFLCCINFDLVNFIYKIKNQIKKNDNNNR